eukprot:NODE_441_length_7368_cov_0.136195.p1 type:complete len:1497 gc:universal NODE_441_length_7368_cov_0.136195:108-4598(+)
MINLLPERVACLFNVDDYPTYERFLRGLITKFRAKSKLAKLVNEMTSTMQKPGTNVSDYCEEMRMNVDKLKFVLRKPLSSDTEMMREQARRLVTDEYVIFRLLHFCSPTMKASVRHSLTVREVTTISGAEHMLETIEREVKFLIGSKYYEYRDPFDEDVAGGTVKKNQGGKPKTEANPEGKFKNLMKTTIRRLSPEDRQMCLDEGLCFLCKDPENKHRARDCPTIRSKHHRTRPKEDEAGGSVRERFSKVHKVKARRVTQDSTIPCIEAEGTVEGVSSKLLVDTGSEVNLVTVKWLLDHAEGLQVKRSPYDLLETFNEKTAEKVLGRVDLRCTLAFGSDAILPFEIVKNSGCHILLGIGSIQPLNIIINGKRGIIEMGNKVVDFKTMKEVVPNFSESSRASADSERTPAQVKKVKNSAKVYYVTNKMGRKFEDPEVVMEEPPEFNGKDLTTRISVEYRELHDVIRPDFHSGFTKNEPEQLSKLCMELIQDEADPPTDMEIVSEEFPRMPEEDYPGNEDIVHFDEIPILVDDGKRQVDAIISEIRFGTTLTQSQKQKVEQLVRKHLSVFTGKLGAKVPAAKIELRDITPYKEKRRHRDATQEAVIAENIEEMLALGYITECPTSEYTHETVLIKKKGTSKWRFCIDFRPLNGKLVYCHYPQADIEDNILRFAGKRYFCKFDMTSGFWQIKLDPESQPYTAFYANGKLYMFCVLPFGIANAPAWFQQILDRVLEGLDFAKAFLDDISMGHETFEGMMEDLERLLIRLDQYNIKLSAKKCYIGFKQMALLGHVIDDSGIRPDDEKVAALLKANVPTNKKELASFHGAMQWHQRYIPDYSIIAKCLLDLLAKKSPWIWDEEHQEAYDKVLNILAKKVVLHYPDPRKPYQIRTDASSKKGLGAVLLQEGLPIFFWSRKLSERELKWHITELECLAIVESLKRFERYVSGQSITVFTDHGALSWLLTGRPALKGKLYRWSIYLSQFQLKIVYIKGHRNLDADFLSRHPCAADAEQLAFSSKEERDCKKGVVDENVVDESKKGVVDENVGDETVNFLNAKVGEVSAKRMSENNVLLDQQTTDEEVRMRYDVIRTRMKKGEEDVITANNALSSGFIPKFEPVTENSSNLMNAMVKDWARYPYRVCPANEVILDITELESEINENPLKRFFPVRDHTTNPGDPVRFKEVLAKVVGPGTEYVVIVTAIGDMAGDPVLPSRYTCTIGMEGQTDLQTRFALLVLEWVIPIGLETIGRLNKLYALTGRKENRSKGERRQTRESTDVEHFKLSDDISNRQKEIDELVKLVGGSIRVAVRFIERDRFEPRLPDHFNILLGERSGYGDVVAKDLVWEVLPVPVGDLKNKYAEAESKLTHDLGGQLSKLYLELVSFREPAARLIAGSIRLPATSFSQMRLEVGNRVSWILPIKDSSKYNKAPLQGKDVVLLPDEQPWTDHLLVKKEALAKQYCSAWGLFLRNAMERYGLFVQGFDPTRWREHPFASNQTGSMG